MYDLLRKGKRWAWNDDAEESLRTVKEDMMKEVNLNYPNLSSDFQILIDSSTVGTAAILLRTENRQQKVLGFVNKNFKYCESK